MDQLVYWIWLSLACTPGAQTFAKLLTKFNDAYSVYDATDKQIRACVGYRISDCTALINKDLTRAEKIYEFCKTKGVGIVTYNDEDYPESLREIQTPPVLLYYRGKIPDMKKFRCAIVGTRRLSDYGRKNTFRLGYDMGCAGAIIVSGMAIGIDSVAMAGAIAAGAPVIAVLGSGIDVCYPEVHRRLAREIVKNGCVFTEYPPGTKPDKYNFPRRNRLISGLSTVTVVMEGSENSGAMITSRYAREQGRPLYALPGNVGADGSDGTNLLLKNGAHPCTCAEDIVYAYQDCFPPVLNPFNLKVKMDVDMFEVLRELEVSAVTPTDNIFKPARPQPKKPSEKAAEPKAVESKPVEPKPDPSALPQFDRDQLKIYKRIPENGDCSIESLVDENYSFKKVMGILLKLEMGRFILMLPGDRVKRNNN